MNEVIDYECGVDGVRVCGATTDGRTTEDDDGMETRTVDVDVRGVCGRG
jgi:hypothetical protein